MTEDHTFTDAELTAYLDAEAGDALRAAIDAALQTDAVLAGRLAALDVPLSPVVAAFDALLDTAPPMPAFDMPATAGARPRRCWGWWGATFGAGLAAGLAVALLTGLGTSQPEPRGWVGFVASYQALYTTATLAIDDPSPQDTAAQLAAVSAAIGVDLTTLPQAQGLTFKRAQVLAFRGKPLIQIAYLRADGTPVALCILPAGTDLKPVAMGQAEGLDIARWNTPGFDFLLIGGTDAAPLAQEAATFQRWSADIAT